MDNPWEELEDEENCPTWIAPYGTTSVAQPLIDDNSAQSSGDETIINEPPEGDQLPSSVSENNTPGAVVQRRDGGQADTTQQSRFLYQYRQQYSGITRVNSPLEPYRSSKQNVEIPIDPVLLNHDKMSNQISLDSNMLREYLERYYGSSNAQVDQGALQQEREVFLKMLNRQMANEQLHTLNPADASSFVRSMDKTKSLILLDRIRKAVQGSLGTVAESSAVNQMDRDNNQAMDPNINSHLKEATAKSINPSKAPHSKRPSMQEIDDVLAAESLNHDTLSALPNSKETGSGQQEGNDELLSKDIQSRLRSRRPYPYTTAEAHSRRVSSVGSKEHFTKPQHTERALLQANLPARAWKPGRDTSIVLYEAELEPSDTLKKVVVNLNEADENLVNQSQGGPSRSAIKLPSVSQSNENRETDLAKDKSVGARPQEALQMSNNKFSGSSTTVQPNSSGTGKPVKEREEFDDLDEWLDDKDLLYDLFPALKEKANQNLQSLPQPTEQESQMDDETNEYNNVLRSGEPGDLEELWPELYDLAVALTPASHKKNSRQD